jgi:hypothetical protein
MLCSREHHQLGWLHQQKRCETHMYWTKEEIAEERDNLVKVLKALRAGRRVLRLQAAQHGNLAPPHIIMELDAVTEKIKGYETELEQLEMRAAEGSLPLAEAEYRLLVAEMWDTERGHPNITGEARMEMARLRLGILPDQAKEIEQRVRISLAQDAMSKIDIRFLPGAHFSPKGDDETRVEQVANLIERAVFLEPDISLSLLTTFLSKPLPYRNIKGIDVWIISDIAHTIEYYLIKRRVSSDQMPVLREFISRINHFIRDIFSNQRNEALHYEDKEQALKALSPLIAASIRLGLTDDAIAYCNDILLIIDQCTDKIQVMGFYSSAAQLYRIVGDTEQAERFEQLHKRAQESTSKPN